MSSTSAIEAAAAALRKVHECADFVCVDKPADVRMDGEFALTMERIVAQRWGAPPLRHCHQLDFATSGCLLYARSAAAAAAAGMLFEQRRAAKQYVALVEGHVLGLRQLLEAAPQHAGALEEVAAGGVAVALARLRTELAVHGGSSFNGVSLGDFEAERERETGVEAAWAPSAFFPLLMARAAEAEAAEAAAAAGTAAAASLSPVAQLVAAGRAGYGQLKYRARLQRSTLGDARPVDDRLEARKAFAAAARAVSGIAEADDLDGSADSAVAFADALFAGLDEVRWASQAFDALMAAALADAARFRRESAALAAMRGVKRLRGDVEASRAAPATPDDAGTAAAPAAAPAAATAATESEPRLRFLVRLPIADVAADGSDFRMRIGRAGDGLPAATLVEVLRLGKLRGSGRPASRLLLTPVTGRRHQLRLHLAALGHPIVGDATYNAHCGGGMACEDAEKDMGAGAAVGARLPLRCDEAAAALARASSSRMMLHAWRLELDLSALARLPGRSFKAAQRWAAARGPLTPLRFEAPEAFEGELE